MPITERFLVRDEDDARHQAVRIQADSTTTKTQDKIALAQKEEYKLASGFRMNMIDKNTFKVVKTGKVMRRVKTI